MNNILLSIKLSFRILLGSLILFSGTSFANASEMNNAKITADELKVATKAFKRYCSKCHGKQGKGDGRMNRLYLKLGVNSPSNFTIGFFESRPKEYLERIIREGGEKNNVSKYMPPFEGELPDETISALVKLISVTGKMREMPK